MKKKLLALLLVVALAVTSVITGTLAYQIDEEADVNVMTLGDVDIKQDEYNADGSEFTQDKDLYPGVYVDKVVEVTNVGDRDAYVRTVVAIEIGDYDHSIVTPDWENSDYAVYCGDTVIDGGTYALYTYTYPDALTAGDSITSLKGVTLSAEAGNEVIASFGEEYKVLVVSQAIQTAGFNTADEALAEGFGTISESNHPWMNGIIGEAWDGTADAEGLAQNTDDKAKTVTIYTADQLAAFAEAVNSGTSYRGYTVSLASDIDLAGKAWTPIGDCNGPAYFQGTFDGNGYTISNLSVDKSEDGDEHSTSGLFGWIDAAGATIKNVTVDGAVVSGSHWVGVIAGYMTGEISNCTVTNATVVGVNVNDEANGDKIGGIVGCLNEHSHLNNNTVSDSTIAGNRDIGGIAGSVAASTLSMVNNYVADTTITYATVKDYASADYIVSGRTGYTPDATNTWSNVSITCASVDPASGLYYNGKTNRGTYYIFNAEDLVKAAHYFVSQSFTNEGNICTIELMADIDLSGRAWEPWTVMWITFNGNDHTISNVTTTKAWRSGFFGYAGAVTVNDLTLENVTSYGAQVGTFAGSAEGLKVNNSYLRGDNSVNYVPDASETWGGAGAVTGVLTSSTINVEITAGTTVTVNKTGLATNAPYVDGLTGYLAANSGTVVNNGTVTICAEVSSAEELNKALANGSNISLTDSISDEDSTPYYGNASMLIDMSNGGTLDGNGNTIEAKGEWDQTYDTVIYTTGGTIKNVTIDGAMRGIFSWGLKEDLILDHVTFNDVIYTVNDDAANGHAIKVSNSVLNGWTSWTSGHSEVSFTDCKFGEGMGYAFVQAHQSVTFTNCEFAEGFKVNPANTSTYLTFVNCTYNGVKITEENVADVLYSADDAYLCIVK